MNESFYYVGFAVMVVFFIITSYCSKKVSFVWIESTNEIQIAISKLNILPIVIIKSIVMEYVGKEFYERHDKPKLIFLSNNICIPLNEKNFYHNDNGHVVIGALKKTLLNVGIPKIIKTIEKCSNLLHHFGERLFLVEGASIFQLLQNDLILFKRLQFCPHIVKFYQNWMAFSHSNSFFTIVNLKNRKEFNCGNSTKNDFSFCVLHEDVIILSHQKIQSFNMLTKRSWSCEVNTQLRLCVCKKKVYVATRYKLYQVAKESLKEMISVPHSIIQRERGCLRVIDNELYYITEKILFRVNIEDNYFEEIMAFEHLSLNTLVISGNFLVYENFNYSYWILVNIKTKVSYDIPKSSHTYNKCSNFENGMFLFSGSAYIQTESAILI